jgi:hypothetical protein
MARNIFGTEAKASKHERKGHMSVPSYLEQFHGTMAQPTSHPRPSRRAIAFPSRAGTPNVEKLGAEPRSSHRCPDVVGLITSQA